MARNYVRENVPLSRFGVLVAQLESIVASASHKLPDPLLCFDLLSDLVSAIDEEPKESILLWQRKCEDALHTLLVLGARRPVRHLASVAMARIIQKGDAISIYSRASTLQGFLSDGKKSEPQRVAGAVQCLGELYRHFGRRITSGLLETTAIVTKLLKFSEEFVRQEALQMLQNALEGSDGNGAASAYVEAYRIIMRVAVGDKSHNVRKAAARCLKAFTNVGGPGLGVAELESSCALCVKALEDPISPVRDAFAEALGTLLALGMNPEAQVQPRGKVHFNPKKLEGCLTRHLSAPFMKAGGTRSKDLRIGLTLSWVSFLQAIHLKYLQPDSELEQYALQAMDMLRSDTSFDAQALACVLYILRVGVTDQMSESTQRGFLVFLGKQLQSPDATPSIRVAALRTLSYALKTLGEVPLEFKEVLDNTIVAAVSYNSPQVRVEAALTLRAIADVDPSCIGGLISYAVTMLSAVRESVAFEKGTNLSDELASLHGQAAVLAALVSISPKLTLGYPARLPKHVFEVAKKMLMESSRNPLAAAVEKEAGWSLLSSLLASMPNEELQDQVFDILSLWAPLFSRNIDDSLNQIKDLTAAISVWAAAVEALTAFVKCFASSDAVNKGILLQPVLLYLNRALSYISLLAAKEQTTIKSAMDVFTMRTLRAYRLLSDPTVYRSDHGRIIQICTTPFRDALKCDESSCLRMLLDKRDAWLGPWTPGRDWFEDELRSFQGGKDGMLPSVWENEPTSFPQPETVSKLLVNEMLLCFGTMFASQDSAGMLSLLSTIDQCLKAGKKQARHAASITNICVGLLAGLKALLALRSEFLGMEILSAAQSIFLSILAEGDICPSQRRAASEGLGLLARLGNDSFTAKLMRSLLMDVNGVTDSRYAGSIALALGCIHHSAGGMALSSLVPATVSSVSLLAKSSITDLQIWSLHGLLLTIEASGLSYVSHVQATLGLAMDILLSDEISRVNLRQGVARLINAIVAVLGPELAPGSIFFSRCKSVIAEISSHQEMATLLESVRFTQQLVLFAPQAVSVHSHLQTLLPTLSSRQPTLRHLALSTIRHLIEKDPASIINEEIEEILFYMLDEETDTEIGNLARTTILRLLYSSCASRPSHWLSICRNMILAASSGRELVTSKNTESDSSSGLDSEITLNIGEDGENMVSSSKISQIQGHALDYSSFSSTRERHLRYRTRAFAAECLSHLPGAVGKNPAHFDLALARKQSIANSTSGDLLVLRLQELVSVAYQISTIQFENMRPIGVALLNTIMDKFAITPDPELPGHLLLEQYQAQLVSAVRTALDVSSGPILLEAGLELATKILTCGIVGQDQAAVKRIFLLISRPLDEFNDLYYPSFAEWVACKIKLRLLTAHASLKCYTYAFLRRQHGRIPDEYFALLPLFSKSSRTLGMYWLSVLKDFTYIQFRSYSQKWKPFLDGLPSSLVSTKIQSCLEEAWPAILQALVLDAVPVNLDVNESSVSDNGSQRSLTSGYKMVELRSEDFRFLWGFSLLVLLQGQDSSFGEPVIPLGSFKSKLIADPLNEDTNSFTAKLSAIVLPVFQYLCTERFFAAGFLSIDILKEFLQVFSYSIFMNDALDSLAVFVLSQIVKNCPKDFLEKENFALSASELCFACLSKFFLSGRATSQSSPNVENTVSVMLATASILLQRLELKMQLKWSLPYLLIGYKYIGGASTELCFSRANDFIQSINHLLRGHNHAAGKSELGDDATDYLMAITRACLNVMSSLGQDCVENIHLFKNEGTNSHKLLQMKLAFSLEQIFSFSKLALVNGCNAEGKYTNPIVFTILRQGIRSMRSVLIDSDIKVQAIGLQVLKGIIHRESSAEYHSFMIFFAGELVGDIITTISRVLTKQINRESVIIAGECLKVLMLIQTLPKESECQRGLMNLILETIVMAFPKLEDNHSQEANEIRSTAIKLVLQLAQIPASAVFFKDVLLAMPVWQRQQIQDIIRASVVNKENLTETKSKGQQLVIKLPAQTEEIKERNSPPEVPRNNSSDLEDEEDDDWDTFQSFPTPSNAPTSTISPAESTMDEKPTLSDDSAGQINSPSSKIEKVAATDQEVAQVGTLVDAAEDFNQIEELQDSQDDSQVEKVLLSHKEDLSFHYVQSTEVGEQHYEPYEEYKTESGMVETSEDNQSSSESEPIEAAAEQNALSADDRGSTGAGSSLESEQAASNPQRDHSDSKESDSLADHHLERNAESPSHSADSSSVSNETDTHTSTPN